MNRVEVGNIAEDWRELTNDLTPSDISYLEALKSAKRQREGASWRALLRRTLAKEEVKKEIAYDSMRAPYLVGSKLYIGASHSSNKVAIVISDRGRCGVDIENLNRDFERVESRYTTQKEIALFEGFTPDYARALIWSSKEALYKAAGFEGVDMVGEVRITSYCDGVIKGEIRGVRFSLSHFEIEGEVVVFTL
ncbi:MAG: 4'-phosphopantetheinyl transferase superfamily protein [Rikenellaceae bacterium]